MGRLEKKVVIERGQSALVVELAEAGGQRDSFVVARLTSIVPGDRQAGSRAEPREVTVEVPVEELRDALSKLAVPPLGDPRSVDERFGDGTFGGAR